MKLRTNNGNRGEIRFETLFLGPPPPFFLMAHLKDFFDFILFTPFVFLNHTQKTSLKINTLTFFFFFFFGTT